MDQPASESTTDQINALRSRPVYLRTSPFEWLSVGLFLSVIAFPLVMSLAHWILDWFK